MITRFFKKWRKIILKCVSPPLVGVVLALCSGLNVYAAEASLNNVWILDNGGAGLNMSVGGSKEFSLLPTSIDVIDLSSGSILGDFKVTPTMSGGTKLGFSFNGSQGTLNYPAYTVSGANLNFDKKYTFVLHYDYDLGFHLNFPEYQNIHVDSVRIPCNFQFLYKPFISGSMSPSKVPAANLTFDNFILHSYDFVASDFNVGYEGNTDNFNFKYNFSQVVNSVNSLDVAYYTVHFFISCKLDSAGTIIYSPYVGSSLESIKQDTDKIAQDQEDYHNQDKNDATNAGSEMQGMATDLETVKSKWEILWYPIEFTNRVMGAFQGSSSARYASAYADVSGYRYDEDSGLLEPIVLNTRSSAVPRANSGTMIHIPAYTLPVLDVQVWEGTDYDLSTLKEQFPDAFNLLYVVVTVLEVMWFVSFLRDKYEEVFG